MQQQQPHPARAAATHNGTSGGGGVEAAAAGSCSSAAGSLQNDAGLPAWELSPDHQQYLAKEAERSLRRSQELQALVLRRVELEANLAVRSSEKPAVLRQKNGTQSPPNSAAHPLLVVVGPAARRLTPLAVLSDGGCHLACSG